MREMPFQHKENLTWRGWGLETSVYPLVVVVVVFPFVL